MSDMLNWLRSTFFSRTAPCAQEYESIEYSTPKSVVCHRYPTAPPLTLLLDSSEDLDLSEYSEVSLVTHLIATAPSPQLELAVENLALFSALTHLIILRSKLNRIPNIIASLFNLQVLDVSDNQLIQLPESISGLKKLKKLFVMYNSLTHLPVGLLDLPLLEDIDVYGNYKLVWPPLKIALLGVADIKGFMQESLVKQKDRQNLLKGAKPYGSSLFGGSLVVPSLKEIVASFIIDQKMEFNDVGGVPPLLKRQLTVVNDLSQFCVTISKCSLCLVYFSSEAAYQAHICKVKK